MSESIFDDRRDYTRLESDAKVLVRGAQSEGLGYLIDLGLGGVGLRTLLPAQIADRLELNSVARPAPPPIAFRVVWAQPHEGAWHQYGLSFEGAVSDFLKSWVCRLFARSGGLSDRLLERRKARRIPIEQSASVVLPGMEPAPVQLVNVGGGGLMFFCEQHYPVGQFATVQLDQQGLTCEGVIVSGRQEGSLFFASLSLDPESVGSAWEDFLRSLAGEGD